MTTPADARNPSRRHPPAGSARSRQGGVPGDPSAAGKGPNQVPSGGTGGPSGAGPIPPSEPAGPDAHPAADGDERARRPAASDRLVELVRAAGVVLFHTPDQEAFAQVPADGRREVYPVRSTAFRRWLTARYFEAVGRGVNGEAMATALNTLEAVAHFQGDEHQVHLRVAPHPGGIVLDLCDDAWRAVVVRPGAWEVVRTPPVLFRRSRQMRPLPEPSRGGDLTALRRFLNLKAAGTVAGAGGADPADDAWLTAVAWLAAAVRPVGPYPLLHLKGAQGTAKSTGGHLLRRVIDPSAVDLKSQPREERDLAVASKHGWAICFDNLSAVPVWLSDALCRVATGGGFGTRALYTDDDEAAFAFMRPVLATSIEDVIGQPDLLDRSLGVELARIEDADRRTEARLWAEFDRALPGILGGLLDVVAGALDRLPGVEAERRPVPRMADFAVFGEAVARTLGEPPGRFLDLLTATRATADQSALGASPIASCVYRLVAVQGAVGGTYTQLLELLNGSAPEVERRKRSWPANAQALSNQLRRITPALNRVGVAVTERKVGRNRVKHVSLARIPDGRRETPPASPASPADAGNTFDDQDLNHLGRLGGVDPQHPPRVRDASAPLGQSHTGGVIAGDGAGDEPVGSVRGEAQPNSIALPYLCGDAGGAGDAGAVLHASSDATGSDRTFHHAVSGDVEEGVL